MATSLVTGWLLGEDESTKTLIYAVLGQHLLCHVLLITYASQEIPRIGVIFLPVRTDAQQRLTLAAPQQQSQDWTPRLCGFKACTNYALKNNTYVFLLVVIPPKVFMLIQKKLK